jgi:hypothetical protein
MSCEVDHTRIQSSMPTSDDSKCRVLALTSAAGRPQAFRLLKVDRQCCVGVRFSQVAPFWISDVSRGVPSVFKISYADNPTCCEGIALTALVPSRCQWACRALDPSSREAPWRTLPPLLDPSALSLTDVGRHSFERVRSIVRVA